MSNSLLDILHCEHRCEITGLPHGRRIKEININSDNLYQLKEAYLGDDSELEEFYMLYLDALGICRQELERMDSMTDEFCTSYLEALKPGPSQPLWSDDQKGLSAQHGPAHHSPNGATSPNSNSPKISDQKGLPGEETLLQEGAYSPQTPSKKRRGNLPKTATNLLKKWLFDHLFHPYPTEEEKSSLALQSGLSLNQISNWFINARRRILQPMLESVRQQQMQGGMEPPQPALQSSSKKRSHMTSQQQ